MGLSLLWPERHALPTAALRKYRPLNFPCITAHRQGRFRRGQACHQQKEWSQGRLQVDIEGQARM